MSGAGAAFVEFRLLGPVEAARDGELLPLGGPRQRALLALLLVEQGRPLSADRLVEELWHGRPPARASGTLPTYVSRLRSALGGDVISSSAGGYAIEVPPEQIDSSCFERLAAEGRAALARGQAGRAAARLEAALGLWRGRPFGDLADEGALRSEADRLEEVRLLAVEDRIGAELQLGRGAELIDELEGLVEAHPYRERLWRDLMLALYRGERQADALAAYQRARSMLDEQFGLEPGDELKQLEQAILRHEVEPVTPPEERHNLPAPLTSFVGREAELAEIERLLGETRLLTLTGVGGVGKTRLALEAVRRALLDYPGGVCLCDFAQLADARIVPHDVATAWGVREQPEVEIVEVLVSHLRDRKTLLVLDNCEHLLDACAELAHQLLSRCPDLRVLATSREALRAPGEVDYPVPPLGLPPVDAGPEELQASDAVRLLVVRARDSRPSLPEIDETFRDAAVICREVDGLPLAIELAAARAKALSLGEIASRLSDRFRFLVSWRRLTPARHRTLREAMDWSYELLSEEERVLLGRLSVFAGGCTLTAVAAVGLEGDEDRAVELVSRLVDASLLTSEEQENRMRYRLLETVRQYAGERLAETGQTGKVRRRHTEYFLALAESANLAPDDKASQQYELVLAEQHNLRAGLDWAIEVEPEVGLRLAVALHHYWIAHDPREGIRRYEALRSRSVDGDLLLRARAALSFSACLSWIGDLDRSRSVCAESIDLHRAAGDAWGLLESQLRLRHLAVLAGELPNAQDLYRDSLEEWRRLGDKAGELQALADLGWWEFEFGEWERGWELTEQAVERARQIGYTWCEVGALGQLSLRTIEAGRIEEGELRAREYVRAAKQIESRTDLVLGLAILARAAAERGDADRARTLWVAIEAEHERNPVPIWPDRREAYAQQIPTGPRTAPSLSLDEAVRSVLTGATTE